MEPYSSKSVSSDNGSTMKQLLELFGKSFWELGTAVLAVGWTVVLPIQSLLLIVGALVFADLFSGVWKVLRSKKEKFSSRALGNTIGKTLGYQLAILVGFAMDSLVGNESPIIARVIAASVASVEAVSILENIRDVTGIDLARIFMDKFKRKTKEGQPENEMAEVEVKVDRRKKSGPRPKKKSTNK
jgi:phosphotransferase system  glucose/maltose/N-acetylglucosamine-specific IIC component